MEFIDWVLLSGVLLLGLALGSAYLRTLPFSNALLYLLLGVALGPLGLGLLEADILADAHWIERLAEVVVIVSLFVGGLKLRLPLGDPAWRAAFWLAGPVMLLCILGVAVFAHLFLGLTPAAALLLGAVLAPTDPVLATAVAVPDAKDKDRLRYALSGEAGLNDGTAFPFVVLALLWIEHGGGWGPWVGIWAFERLLWAVPAGLGLGFALGFGVGRLAIRVRQRTRDPATSSDLLLLALVALSYALAEYAQAWGFLAVFAAGVGLRRAEVRTVQSHPVPRSLGEPGPLPPEETPAEALLEREVSAESLAHPTIASGAVVRDVLSFGEVLERLMALVSVVLTGVLVSLAWDWRGVALAAVLFGLIRPLAVALCLSRTPTTRLQRGLIAWFGLRGVGSLYYLSYAVGEGLGRGRAEDVSGLALTVVALSVLLHGSSVTPLLGYYERSLEQADRGGGRSKAVRRRDREL